MIFHDITLLASGTQLSRRQHDSAKLVREAVEVFAAMLRDHPDGFRLPIPHPAFAHIELQWTQERPGAALATFWCKGELATTSALVTGSNAEADSECLQVVQQMIARTFRNTPLEPGFDILSLTERPLIVSLPWPNPKVSRDDMMVAADMETCLMGAFAEVAT